MLLDPDRNHSSSTHTARHGTSFVESSGTDGDPPQVNGTTIRSAKTEYVGMPVRLDRGGRPIPLVAPRILVTRSQYARSVAWASMST